MSCECQRCCARERGGRTTEQAGERDGGGDNAISGPIRNCWRLSDGTREMSIRFFGYFAGRRYLAPRAANRAVPNISPVPPAVPLAASLACVFRTVPLDPRHGPRRISHITFRESPPPSPLSSSPPPCCPPSLLSHPGPGRSERFYSREIAFKLFGFLTRRGFIARSPRCNAHKVPDDLREVGNLAAGESAA